jgi:hypothetical protein
MSFDGFKILGLVFHFEISTYTMVKQNGFLY